MAASAFRVLVLGQQHVLNPPKKTQEAEPAGKGHIRVGKWHSKVYLIHFTAAEELRKVASSTDLDLGLLV